MNNFVFISPTFPDTYYQFPKAWKELGGNALCIGEDDYDSLSENMKNAMTAYYQVSSLEDYDQVYKAVAWFSHKFGKIDWIESHNEYWLRQDARLRTDFNITTGDNDKEVLRYKNKSTMKDYYKQCDVKTARWIFPTSLEVAKEFIQQVGYPVIVKPDDGVGANATWKIRNEQELENFFRLHIDVPYIMEEFITGEIWSYDGLVDQNNNIIFRSVNIYKTQVIDVLNAQAENYFYSLRDIPEDIETIGAKVIHAFNIKARFFHTEYFRMTEDKEGLGKKGDLIGLEVNMRTPGGYIPDMMNYAYGANLYRMYARMCMFNESGSISKAPYHCVYTGKRDRYSYKHSNEDVYHNYGQAICMSGRMPGILQGMGDDYFIARFTDLKDIEDFAQYVFLK